MPKLNYIFETESQTESSQFSGCIRTFRELNNSELLYKETKDDDLFITTITCSEKTEKQFEDWLAENFSDRNYYLKNTYNF